MGVIYTKTSDGRVLRHPPSEAERIDLIRRFYEPHHAALKKAVRASLAHSGSCLIVDCHSFPSDPLPSDLDQSRPRPDICIGTDPYHTPNGLTEAAKAVFQAYGYSVAINRPYRGALVPAPFYKSNGAVLSIMIEVNRALYMNERTGGRLPAFGEVFVQIQEALKSLILVEKEAGVES